MSGRVGRALGSLWQSVCLMTAFMRITSKYLTSVREGWPQARLTSNTFLYGIKYACGGKYLIEDDLSGVVTIWDSSLTHAVQQINAGRMLNIARGPACGSFRLVHFGVGA